MSASTSLQYLRGIATITPDSKNGTDILKWVTAPTVGDSSGRFHSCSSADLHLKDVDEGIEVPDRYALTRSNKEPEDNPSFIPEGKERDVFQRLGPDHMWRLTLQEYDTRSGSCRRFVLPVGNTGQTSRDFVVVFSKDGPLAEFAGTFPRGEHGALWSAHQVGSVDGRKVEGFLWTRWMLESETNPKRDQHEVDAWVHVQGEE